MSRKTFERQFDQAVSTINGIRVALDDIRRARIRMHFFDPDPEPLTPADLMIEATATRHDVWQEIFDGTSELDDHEHNPMAPPLALEHYPSHWLAGEIIRTQPNETAAIAAYEQLRKHASTPNPAINSEEASMAHRRLASLFLMILEQDEHRLRRRHIRRNAIRQAHQTADIWKARATRRT